MARKTKEEAAATRGRILDAAITVFLECGVSRASLLDVASAAGVSRGAVYWHFVDKAALFDALMMERATLALQCGLQEFHGVVSADPLRDLRNYTLAVLRLVDSNPGLRQVFEIALLKVEHVEILGSVQRQRRLGMAAWLSCAERYVRLARELGLVARNTDSHMVGLSVWSLMEGLLRTWLLDLNEVKLLRLGEFMIDTYITGLRAVAPVADEAHAECVVRR